MCYIFCYFNNYYLPKKEKVMTKKPFHESIIFVIAAANEMQLIFLADLIKETKIPKDHIKIADVWRKKIKEFGMEDDLGVPASILN